MATAATHRAFAHSGIQGTFIKAHSHQYIKHTKKPCSDITWSVRWIAATAKTFSVHNKAALWGVQNRTGTCSILNSPNSFQALYGTAGTIYKTSSCSWALIKGPLHLFMLGYFYIQLFQCWGYFTFCSILKSQVLQFPKWLILLFATRAVSPRNKAKVQQSLHDGLLLNIHDFLIQINHKCKTMVV